MEIFPYYIGREVGISHSVPSGLKSVWDAIEDPRVIFKSAGAAQEYRNLITEAFQTICCRADKKRYPSDLVLQLER
jgi:hypothetical protein